VNTVTGEPTGRAAHAARPTAPVRALLIALAVLAVIAGVALAVVQYAGSISSEPGSAQRITAPPRPSAAPVVDPT